LLAPERFRLAACGEVYIQVSQNNGASAPPAEEQVQQVEEAAGSGNPSEGNPSAASVAPLSQAQTQAAQNTAQGDAAAPLETGARQRSDTEKQQTAEAKAACEAALAKLNKERQQQQCLREAQELYKCLSSGMDLLTPGQVRQITDAVTTAGNEPMDALRSFGERLRILREENPHASETDLREAIESAVRVIVTRAKDDREQQQRTGTQQVAAAFEVPREALHLSGAHRVARQDIPGPPSGRMLRGQGAESEWSRCTTTSVASGSTCTRQSGTATRISLEATIGLCIQGSHEHTKQPTERQTPGGGTLLQLTACFRRWRSPRPHCCRQLSRCCKSWRKRPEPTGKREQSTTPHRLPTWQARHSRP